MTSASDLVQRYRPSRSEILSEIPLVATPGISLDDPALFINREISWLRFNRRVLEEAQDPWHPLLERAKFLAICGSNMDEFFMTRVAGLLKKMNNGEKKRSLDKQDPYQQIRSTRREIIPLLKDYGEYWREELVPALAKEGIRIKRIGELGGETKRYLREYFEEAILPSLDLPIKDPTDVFVENLRINLFVVIHDSETDKEAYYIVEVPTDRFPRLVEIPKDHSLISSDDDGICYVFLEDLIGQNLDVLFPGSNIEAFYVFRLTRNAEIEIIMDESADFLEVMKRSVETRRVGFPTRLQYERRMPRKFREILANLFDLARYLLYECDAPLGLVDLWQLLKIERPDLKDRSFLPYTAPLLRGLNHGRSLLSTISRNDLVLYHPYDGFEVIIGLLRESSRDPDVVSIKITVYRMDPRSPVVDALMEAAKNGKKVTAFIELKAKFDEEHNIDLAKHLQEAGVATVYRFPRIKVHAKLCLIERRENGRLVRYSHIGSGNYNAVTTKIYGDTGYLTARQEIGAELANLFKVLTENSYTKDFKYKYLLVAPKTLKDQILMRIDREIECHRRRGHGYLAFKLNGLEDKEIIQALYRASMAGVRCELNVRGLCCLRPGIPGISDNITVISIVGRFLEHARIYYFNNCGKDEVLLGSSDMMFRNLNKRVEVLFSVPDQRIKRSILERILMVHLRDNVKARRLLPEGRYVRVECPEGLERINSQDWLIENRGVWHA